MRVKEYDPFANEFEVDTQGLDFCPVKKDWFSPPPVNLNDDLRKGYLKILDKNEVLWFNTNIYKARRQMFDQNIVGRGLEIKFEGNNRYTNVKVRSYDPGSRTHVVAVEGSATGAGASPKIDLNSLMLKGRIRLEPPAISRMVASRWLAIAQVYTKGPRENSSDAPVAWPMPKGGKHEIT